MPARNRTMGFPGGPYAPTARPGSVLGTPTDQLTLHYHLGKVLGRGRFGVIRQCTNKVTGESFACKSIPKLKLTRVRDLEDVRREIDIMRALSAHPNVVGFQDVYEDTAHVHLVMELCEGGDLFDRIVKRRFYPEREAALLFKTLVEVVEYCHQMGVIHRDLKPENILLATDSRIKLADFGLALRFAPGDNFSGKAGSAYYMAPEILCGRYSEEVDVWSVGVILYILLCGAPPFWGKSDQDICKAILEGEIDFTSNPWGQISLAAKDLISRMLCPNPKARPSPAEVLKHPWILLHTTQSELDDRRKVPQDSSQNETPCRTKDAEDVAAASPDGREHLQEGVLAAQEETCLSEGCSSIRSSLLATISTDGLLPQCSPDLQATPGFSLQRRAEDASMALSSSQCETNAESTASPRSSTQAASASSCSSSTPFFSESPSPDGFDRWASFSQVAEPTFSEFRAAVVSSLHTLNIPPSPKSSPAQEQDEYRSTIVRTSGDKDTIMVDSAEGNYVVIHDRSRRRIRWKCLGERDCGVGDSKDCNKLFEKLSRTLLCSSSPPLIIPSEFPLLQQSQLVL